MEFTIEDLRLIKACCVTACPQYPNKPMYEPWASLYIKADRMLERAELAKVYGPALVDHVLSQTHSSYCPDYCTHPECQD